MTNKQIAKKIARELFTPGSGPRATRLVSFDGLVDLKCGWGEKPMADHILKILDAAKPSGDTKRLDFIASQLNRPTKTLRATLDAAMKKKGEGK